MTKADGTATATGGDLIATFAETSKEHQVVMVAGTDGHIVGSRLLYVFQVANQVHVAAASTVHWDLFNAVIGAGTHSINVHGAVLTTGAGQKAASYSGTLNLSPVVVPEPATWGLMIMGFGGVGAMIRTRRRLAVALA